LEFDRKKPTVAVLGTGGTIASFVDYKTGAVYPALSAQDLVFSVPELTDLCNIRARVLYSILSENMKVEYWQRLAEESAKELNSGAEAVIIPHGTDTLGYTSAALSFMMKNLSGPVILVGSQRSSDRPSSDAFMNLLCSARLASSDLGEVVVVMHGETSDSFCTIHRGTKIRKMHSSRRDAFQSMNEKPLGRVHEDGRIEFESEYRRKAKGEVKAETRMEERVSLLYFYPGLKKHFFEKMAEDSKGIVIAGTGLGHVSTDLIPSIEKAIKKGVHVVMTTQCLSGRVGMYVYATGRELANIGVIPGEDMLPETAYVKLMWVLGKTSDPKEVRELMTRNLVGEINESLRLEGFGK